MLELGRHGSGMLRQTPLSQTRQIQAGVRSYHAPDLIVLAVGSMDLLPEGRSPKKSWQEAILLRGRDRDRSFPVSPT